MTCGGVLSLSDGRWSTQDIVCPYYGICLCPEIKILIPLVCKQLKYTCLCEIHLELKLKIITLAKCGVIIFRRHEQRFFFQAKTNGKAKGAELWMLVDTSQNSQRYIRKISIILVVDGFLETEKRNSWFSFPWYTTLIAYGRILCVRNLFSRSW